MAKVKIPALLRKPASQLLRYTNRYQGYIVAIVASAVVFGLKLTVPYLGSPSPFLAGVLPVVLAALAGGIWPGLLAAVIAEVGISYLFLPPERGLTPSTVSGGIRMALFLLECGIALWLIDRQRRSEKRFRSSMDLMIEGCQIIGRDWRYIYINDSAERQNNRPKEELLGRKYTDMWPGIETTHVYEVIRECMEKRVARHLVNEFTFPDGKVGWFDLRIHAIPEGVFILSFDISVRKRAEQALEESQALFDAIFDNTPALIGVYEEDGKCVRVNKASAAWIGRPAEEVAGRSIFDYAPKDLAKGTLERNKAVIDSGQPSSNRVSAPRVPGNPAAGTLHWQGERFPVPLPGGKKGVGVINIDVTEQVLAEEKLRISETSYIHVNYIDSQLLRSRTIFKQAAFAVRITRNPVKF